MTKRISEPPEIVRRFASAKINLALHVTGRRTDGLHLLDSLIAFADVGDSLEGQIAPDLTLSITGPMAAGLSSGSANLILKAARLFGGNRGGAALRLEKTLPLASGIGGGSADAAAALHLLADIWQLPLPPPEAVLSLGADVPVCLFGKAARMQGIGEVLTPLALPEMPAVLVNSGIAVPTAAVFSALTQRDTPPLPPPPDEPNREVWFEYLNRQRNDLEPAAARIAPDIGATLVALAGTRDCRLTRMSGSGATCFGLYDTPKQAATAASAIAAQQPGWWCKATVLA